MSNFQKPTKMNSKQNNKSKPKIILLAILPVILVMVIVFLFFNKKEENRPTGNLHTPPSDLLIPQSEDESFVITKIDAYGKEAEERRKFEKETAESENYSENDFFMAVNNDRPMDLKKNVTLDKLYQDEVATSSKQQDNLSTNSNTFLTSGKKSSGNSTAAAKTQRQGNNVEKLYNEAATSSADNTPPSTATTKAVQTYEASPPPVAVTENGRKRRPSSTSENTGKNMIKACIDGDQTVVNDGSVRMRLLENLMLDGIEIPANTSFSGRVNIGKYRIHILVTELLYKDRITPVNFKIYDLDALEGLELPPNIKQAMAKQGSQSALSNIPSATTNSIIGTLIDGATTVVKSTTANSIAEQKVYFKMNYQLLIKTK